MFGWITGHYERGKKFSEHPVDGNARSQDPLSLLGVGAEDLSHYGVEFMPDAQRRDKLPLMNGPTANSWPSGTRIRRETERKGSSVDGGGGGGREGGGGRGQRKVASMPPVLVPFSKSHRILSAIFITTLCPCNLTRARARIPKYRVAKGIRLPALSACNCAICLRDASTGRHLGGENRGNSLVFWRQRYLLAPHIYASERYTCDPCPCVH